jgi:hypothetical protein
MALPSRLGIPVGRINDDVGLGVAGDTAASVNSILKGISNEG